MEGGGEGVKEGTKRKKGRRKEGEARAKGRKEKGEVEQILENPTGH